MKGLKGLLQYIRPYKSLVVLSIVCNILLSIFTIVSIPLVIPFFQILFDRAPLSILEPEGYDVAEWLEYYFSQLIASTDRETALLYVCLAIVLVFFLKNVFRYLALYFMAPVRNGIVRDIRNKLFNTYQHLPLGYFSEKKKGDLISRAITDVQEIEWSILNVIEVIFKSPLIIIGSILLMIYISPGLTQFVLVLILFTGLIIGRIGKTLKKSSSQAQQSVSRMTSTLEESIGGVKVVRAFRAESFLSEKFGAENNEYMSLLTRILRRRDMSSPLTEFLGVSVVAVLLWYGSTLVFAQSLAPESFFAFIFAFYQVLEPSKSFSTAYYNIQKGLAAKDRVDDIINHVPKVSSGQLNLSGFSDSIVLDQVSFRYPTSTGWVIKEVSLKINKGEKIAIVGSSGSGKTTLIDLILGFYQVNQGTITIDGININDASRDSITTMMGLVTQSPILFNDTVRNNILFGEDYNDEAVKSSASIAFADEFIEQLPEDYETNIGDSGVKLSGGQRQRLTLARAILRNPSILILDEATSALDSESEKLVQLAMDKILEHRTAIIIAHRLSTIKNVDKIIVMKDGSIVEEGSHEDLINHNGAYKKFVSTQNLLS
ncbi:MAG: ABC transporter ATP-binding protein [Saprospiraceae bacterium]|nr:ABC transporter ATP-binding protein [Saprospiraceae bacterium]